jgi:tetratricopeptide (TPR) repeat protein
MAEPIITLLLGLGLGAKGLLAAAGLEVPGLEQLSEKAAEIARDVGVILLAHRSEHELENLKQRYDKWRARLDRPRNEDLERGVARSAIFADLLCLMDAAPDLSREWRLPEWLQTRRPVGLFEFATSTWFPTAKDDCRQRLENLTSHPTVSPMDSFQLVRLNPDVAWGVERARGAFNDLCTRCGAPPRGVDKIVDQIFEHRWFEYLCLAFCEELKTNERMRTIFSLMHQEAGFGRLEASLNEAKAEIGEEVRGGIAKVLESVAEVKAALDNPRVAPVKEPLINLPNTTKSILARDREALELLDALHPTGPGIVSIAAPPGFGKSAVFALALRMALSDNDPRQAGLDGIAVLDARTTAPGIVSFAHMLGRITGLQETAGRFASAAAESPAASLRALFFDFLRQAGKVWLVVENAETVLAPAPTADSATEFLDLVRAWCHTDHQAKLLLLTRHALHPAPQCHRRLKDVEDALLGGLPEEAALKLLRQRLAATRFGATGDPLLRQIVQRLHRVPMAIEQLVGYLDWNEQGIELNQRFLDQNDLLRLHASEQMEDFLLRITSDTLGQLDAPSLSLLRLVAWAGLPVPRSGLLAFQSDSPALLTRLHRSNLLIEREGTAAEGRSFDMHSLIREALGERSGAALNFARIALMLRDAGDAESTQGQFRPALTLYDLAARAAKIACKPDEVALTIVKRGKALQLLHRLEEAISDFNESITIYRKLVEGENRQELRNELAAAIMSRGLALWILGRLEEAVTAYDETITIYRDLVETEHRQDLRDDLAGVIMNRGNALKHLGRQMDALVAFDESITIYREMVEGQRRQELRNDLAAAVENSGITLWALGRPMAALTALHESITIYRELVEVEHRQEYRNRLANGWMNWGTMLKELGKLEDAVVALDESVAIRRELVEGEQHQELRNDLAATIMNRGITLQALGRLEDAVADCNESVTIYRELVEGEHHQELRNNLALAWYALACARAEQGAAPEAIGAARAASQLWEALVSVGLKHLEPSLALARALDARLTRGSAAGL